MNWQPNTEGTFLDLPAETYHAAPGLSNSMLKEFRRSPKHLKAAMNEKKPPTEAMLLGSLFHSLILEPEKAPWWAVRPAGLDGRTAAGKQWKVENAGKHDFEQAVFDNMRACADSVLANKLVQAAMNGARHEVSVFQNFSYGGTVLRKARIDLVPIGNALLDFKTTTDARRSAFTRDAYDLMYHMQAAYYLDVWNDAHPKDAKSVFVFVAVEKVRPYEMMTYEVSQRAVQAGRLAWIDSIPRYAECVERNEWPGYPDAVELLELPAWASKKEAA